MAPLHTTNQDQGNQARFLSNGNQNNHHESSTLQHRRRTPINEQHSPVHQTRSISTASTVHRVADQSDDSSVDPVASSVAQGTAAESNHMEFKIFRTVNNEEYTVYVRDEDGAMFFVDWEHQVCHTCMHTCNI